MNTNKLTNGADLKGLITILWSLVTNYILSLSEVITSLVLFFLIFTIIIIFIVIIDVIIFIVIIIFVVIIIILIIFLTMTIFIPS